MEYCWLNKSNYSTSETQFGGLGFVGICWISLATGRLFDGYCNVPLINDQLFEIIIIISIYIMIICIIIYRPDLNIILQYNI